MSAFIKVEIARCCVAWNVCQWKDYILASELAEPSQQKFAVPIFHKNIQGVRTCPPTKTQQRRWKINSVANLSHFSHWFLASLFLWGEWAYPSTRKVLKNCPRLSPQECMPKKPPWSKISHMEPTCSCQSCCLLEAALSEPCNQELPLFVTMPYLILSFLNINSFILKNSQWDIHHNFTLLFLKNRYTALSCTTSNRKYFPFVGT